ncbi:MAG TPA: SDR family NAD(P)-dependent oxidoreductase [Chitinophagales bacterium]|nr:SDR family NAD(P)-dependent oxidoreductase [Chitinophagales bacterium]HQW80044.1 SDR family NAD(P)-dependent oxidoreductase [Chitinophagales bacterium]HRB18983.1 SDR family NAD(P)-dependent oxidoreductase [Chitinophagales bacterium]HRB66478.1 SDR family NAD(P)-dependent oxidoreductase [Chitinophagales bacterium]HRB91860.1 SDR family NAD(P)-dependent oxidoreductase [Chitinophagales bacterium]
MSQIRGANVLITGGANGIGKLMGLKCLQEGASHLVIWDINKENLYKTQKEFSAKGYKNVSTFVIDVANVDDIERAATEVLLEIGNIDILFNNAGIVAGKQSFWDYSVRDIEKTIAINVTGVMHVSRVFLKDMIKQRKGHVVNIASASSFISLPKGSVYASSKWAVFGWSESLRLELEEEGSDLHVTTVCPSYIDTGMFKGVKSPLLFPLLQPEDVSNRVVTAVKKNEIILLLPERMGIVPALKGLIPTRTFDKIAGFLGVYSSMTNFEGRPKNERIPDKNLKVK